MCCAHGRACVTSIDTALLHAGCTTASFTRIPHHDTQQSHIHRHPAAGRATTHLHACRIIIRSNHTSIAIPPQDAQLSHLHASRITMQHPHGPPPQHQSCTFPRILQNYSILFWGRRTRRQSCKNTSFFSQSPLSPRFFTKLMHLRRNFFFLSPKRPKNCTFAAFAPHRPHRAPVLSNQLSHRPRPASQQQPTARHPPMLLDNRFLFNYYLI